MLITIRNYNNNKYKTKIQITFNDKLFPPLKWIRNKFVLLFVFIINWIVPSKIWDQNRSSI
jgi:hypothetical protein